MSSSLETHGSVQNPVPASNDPNQLGTVELIGRNNQILKTWKVRHGECIVGSAPEAGIRLQSPNIGNLHAKLSFGRRHTIVKSLGGGVWIEGRATREALLDRPTLVDLGGISLRVTPALQASRFLASNHDPLNNRFFATKSAFDPSANNVEGSPSSPFDPESGTSPSDTANTTSAETLIPAVEKVINSLVEPLKGAVEQLRASVDESRQTNVEPVAAQPIHDPREEFARFELSLSERIEKRIDAMTAEIERLRNDNHQLLITTESTKQRTEEHLQSQFEEARRKIEQYEEQIQRLRDERDRAQNRSVELSEEMTRLAEEKARLDAANSNQQTQQQQLADQLQLLDRQLREVQASAEQNAAEWHAASLSLQEQLQHWQRQAQHLQDEVERREALLLDLDRKFGQSALHAQTEPSFPETAYQAPTSYEAPASYQAPAGYDAPGEYGAQDNVDYDPAYSDYPPASSNATYFEEPAVEYPLTAQSSSSDDTPESFETSYEQSSYEQSSYEQSSYEQSSYEQSSYEQPSYEQPADEQPSYQQEEYGAFSYGSENDDRLDEQPGSESQVSQLSGYDLANYNDLPQADANSEEYSQPSSDEHSLSRLLIESLGQEEPEADSRAEEFIYGGSELRDAESDPLDSSPFGEYVNRLQVTEQESVEYDQEDGYDQEEQLELPTSFDQQATIHSQTNYESELHYGSGLKTQSEEQEQLQLNEFEESDEDLVDEPFEMPERLTHVNEATVAESAAPASNSAGAAEEEDSIEAYMQQLLQRVRGGNASSSIITASPAKEPATPKAQPTSSPATKATTATTTSTSPSPAPATDPTTTGSWGSVTKVEAIQTTPAEVRPSQPRPFPPEKTHDMAAFRELANNTARKAIERSDRRKLGSEVFFKSAVAVIGFIGGMFLIIVNGLEMNMALVGAIAGFGVAGLWGVDAINLGKSLLILQPPADPRDLPAVPSEDSAESTLPNR